MTYLERFNIPMMPYGTGGGGGGGSTGDSGGGGDPIVNLAGAGANPAFGFVGSEYNFTNPPRYYKANDPYYYEVDNIPLKQIHENCLWLKDQIEGVSLSVTGVSTYQILDLQPFSTNADRLINVRPGKFIGRVNDAYSIGGLFSPTTSAPTIDLTRTPVYQTPSVAIDNDAFRILVGSTVESLLYNNGLYDHYQHHAAVTTNVTPNPENVNVEGVSITYSFASDFLQDPSLVIANLPKIKTAVWQQISSTFSQAPPFRVDLQQLSVDFCRRWQGVFRTSVVNIPEQLSIQISPFDESDYIDNNSTYDPQVRIDLVYAYTKPIDTPTTTLSKSTGTGLETIASPRLGVAKGAGGILTAKSYGAADVATDIISDPALLGQADWINQSSQRDRYYDTTQNLDATQDIAMQAPLADQVSLNAEGMPFPGKGTGLSFPSPDDLLNLAPIVSQDSVDGSIETVGQSVLPICYVVVKRGEAVITSDDIIDVRPFLRTAELAYNERAGVGAATPPLSLANPAVGKHELYNAIELLRDVDAMKLTNLDAKLSELIQQVPIAKARFTCILFNAIIGSGYQPIPFKESSTHSNTPPLPQSYLDMLGGPVMVADEESGVINMIPGIYLVEAKVNAYPQNYNNSNARAFWKMYLSNGAAALFPVDEANRPGFRTYSDEHHAYKQESGSTTISALVTIDETSVGALSVKVGRVSGSSSTYATIRGSMTVTRIANLDGTEGPVTEGTEPG